MTEPVLHGECPQCGSCWGCWEQTVTTLRELLFSVTEDRNRLRDKYEPVSTGIKESVEAVVEMMNSGQVDPAAVYPRGNRYHGD